MAQKSMAHWHTGTLAHPVATDRTTSRKRPVRYRYLALTCALIVVASCGGQSDGGAGPDPEPKVPHLVVVSGDRQTDTVGQTLPLPLTVVLRDTLDQPIPGASVSWSVVSGGGAVAAGGITDANGEATATYTLGLQTKLNSVRATTPAAPVPLFFTLTAVHDVPAQLLKSAGDSQYAEIGQVVVASYAVKVSDQYGNAVPQVSVDWSVASGGGSVSPASSVSDAAGIAQTRHTVGSAGDNMVTATVAGLTGSPVNFTSRGVLPATLVSQVIVPANYGAHDTFVRDGIAFHCAWNTGMIILDVGNGIRGGSPANPVEISRIITDDNDIPGGPSVHNAWWFHNPVTNEKRYVFVGQEGAGINGSSSSGDIHVVDVSNLSNPVEVAFFTLPNAGTHNFWVDEPNQILYVGYYSGGVVAIDVSGTLLGNISSRKIAQTLPGGASRTFTWGVQLYNGYLYASDIESGFYQLQLSGLNLSVLAGGNNIPSNDGIGTDLWVANGYGYTGFSGKSRVFIWRLDPTGAPVQIGSIPAPAGTFNVSDVEVSPSGKLLMFSTEGGSGAGFYFFNLSDPANPKFVSRYPVSTGIHTATFGTIGGRLYAFGAKDPPSPSVMILDVTSLDL